MDEMKERKLQDMFSVTLRALERCYEDFGAPIWAVLKGGFYDYETECRRKLIALCGKIAKEYDSEKAESL